MRARTTAPLWAIQGTGRNSRAQRMGWEKRRENDERVAVNLRGDHQALWNKTKGQFKGTPQQREKAFKEYAHKHGGENTRALQHHADHADHAVDRMIREYQNRPRVAKTRGARARPRAVASDVPF